MKARSERQSFLGIDSDEQLQQATIAIVGASGGGSPINQQVAHIGFGTVHVFDPAFAQEHHRQRLIGISTAAVRRRWPKAHIAKRVSKRVNPEGLVIPHPCSWQQAHEVLRSCDLVFSCVDGYLAREELERYLRRFHIPMIDIGMDVTKHDEGHQICGQVILSMPGRHCMRCFGYIRDDLLKAEAARYGVAGANAQVVWPNGALASAAVGLAMSLLLPWHSRREIAPYLVYDGNRLTITPSTRLQYITEHACPHFPNGMPAGDPMFSVNTALMKTA